MELVRNNRSINKLDLWRMGSSNPEKAKSPGKVSPPMKAAAFAYARAKSVDDALQLLAAHGDRAKVLSGGQSLMPAMNLRLLAPELIVDIGSLDELRGIQKDGDIL